MASPSLPNPIPAGYVPPSNLDFGHAPPTVPTMDPQQLANMPLANQSTYWHGKISEYVGRIAATTDPTEFAKLKVDLQAAQASADQADKQIQQNATDSHASQSESDVAARAAAAQAETDRHNKVAEGTSAFTAGHTAANEDAHLSLAQQLAGIQAEGEAIRAKAEQDTAAAKGDANKIAQARLAYEQASAANTQKLNLLKDQVTSIGSLDNNETTESVNQANSRNNSALQYLNGANTNITDLSKLGAFAGNPGGAAGALTGLMKVAPSFSAAQGGGAVPVGQLTDQHKAEIMQLVMAGTPFSQAVQQTAANAAAAQQGGPMSTGDMTNVATMPTPGYTAGAGTPAAGFSVNPSAPSAEQEANTYTGGH